MQFIDTTREGLGHILADNHLYVPTYQRSYAWRSAHVESLINDLAGAIRKKPNEGPSDYFLGSIVAVSRDAGLEIVDGQQRLVTTSLILAAIRDQFLVANDKDMADSIQKTYLCWFDMRTREFPARMRLNESDNDFYLKWALALPNDRPKAPPASRPSHHRIKRAYGVAAKHFRGVWQQYTKADAADALVDWINFLRENAQVIRVTVQDAADAYVIFETLNDRGLELSTSDLLKNYLFGRSGTRIEETKARWSAMVGALETVSKKDLSVDYIRQLWGSMHGLTRKRELFYKIKEDVTNQRTAIDLSTQLEDNAKLYAAILNPNHELWSQYGTSTRQALATIRILRMERLRPLLLSILNSFSVNEVKKSLKWLIAASVRLNIIGGGSSGPTEIALAEAAVRCRKRAIRNTKQLAVELTQDHPVIPGNDVFERAFSVARVKNAQIARYYLRALDEALIDSSEVYVVSDNEDRLNLEHILPERGRGRDWSHVPDAKANELCRRLGNMVLLHPKVNSQLQSKPFAQKVKLYAESNNTRLTKKLAKKYGRGRWGEDAINEWQGEMAKLALKAWSLKVH